MRRWWTTVGAALVRGKWLRYTEVTFYRADGGKVYKLEAD